MILLSFVLVFWNVENFFDPTSGAHPQTWTKSRYYTKCNGIAKTVLAIADSCGSAPDVLAFAEVENRECLASLAYNTALRKYGYRIVHYDSPDSRGIDCGLLYRGDNLRLLSSRARHLFDADSTVIATRDILIAEFVCAGQRSDAGVLRGDSLAVLVNHHPSKRGGSAEAARRREIALRTLNHLCDSLQSAGFRTVIAVGDFNDTRTAWSDSLLFSMTELCSSGSAKGTIKYNGGWELIDRALISEGEAQMTIYDAEFLTTRDRGFGGTKPLRTFSGPRYLGGLSDHYPIVVNYSSH